MFNQFQFIGTFIEDQEWCGTTARMINHTPNTPTTRCIYRLDSLASLTGNCTLWQSLLNWTVAQGRARIRANERMIEFLSGHLRVASNHTKFVHSLGKTIDCASDSSLVFRALHHLFEPIFDKPAQFVFLYSQTFCNQIYIHAAINTYTECLL